MRVSIQEFTSARLMKWVHVWAGRSRISRQRTRCDRVISQAAVAASKMKWICAYYKARHDLMDTTGFKAGGVGFNLTRVRVVAFPNTK